jgi:hypothetical protein
MKVLKKLPKSGGIIKLDLNHQFEGKSANALSTQHSVYCFFHLANTHSLYPVNQLILSQGWDEVETGTSLIDIKLYDTRPPDL